MATSSPPTAGGPARRQNGKKAKNKAHKVASGPLLAENGVPYDYFVVIDAGSSGSRVYVYNWPNPQHALKAGAGVAAADVRPVRQFFEKDVGGPSTDSDSDSDSDSDDPRGAARLPRVASHKKWHRKITPGLSSFSQSPQKVGKHHIRHLLNLASAVVPKSEHRRTPIFLHATAGMRLLPPNEQEPILENVCRYLAANSDFFVPDCRSHVNVIDGAIEGLYGWLSVNYLKGAFDRPQEHQHGKNHSTYGLLDMGGASTQVVFQPNATEIAEHTNNLYRVSLALLPEPAGSSYSPPQVQEAHVYSDTFLGFGMFQAHSKYIKNLLHEYRREHGISENTYRFRTPVPDPCLPKGYTFTGSVDDHDMEYTGSSNFKECLQSIFPVLANNTYTSEERFSGACQQLGEESRVSSCLLNDLIPAFDFDVNHFIGVSGYWDTINSLLASQELEERPADQYDYSLIYSKTSEFCSQPLNELLAINALRGKDRIKEEELAQLCFKSSWILNFLHVGLGFPRFGIDEVNKEDKFKSLQLVDKVDGSSFSWTLGRAMLYANDEYAQAFNNYTETSGLDVPKVPRPGYVFTATDSFVHGAEEDGVMARPMYAVPVAGTKYPYYDYEYRYKDADESKWYIQPHRFYGEVIFGTLLLVALGLMLGRGRRQAVFSAVKEGFGRMKRKVSGSGYARVDAMEMTTQRREEDEPTV